MILSVHSIAYWFIVKRKMTFEWHASDPDQDRMLLVIHLRTSSGIRLFLTAWQPGPTEYKMTGWTLVTTETLKKEADTSN